MTKAQVKAKYDAAANAATATLAVGVGDLKLKASCADHSFVSGSGAGGASRLRGVSLGVEKPGAFLFDYDLHSQAPRFQFMTSANVVGEPLKLTYIHAQKRNATMLEGSVALDVRNKVTAKYSFATEKGQLKYTYVHGSGTMLEPSYDFHTESWHFAAARHVGPHDHARVCFDGHHKTVGLEWTRDSKELGAFKVTATVNADAAKMPKVVAEKTWSCDF